MKGIAGLNNSIESLSKIALKQLKNFTPSFDEQWKYTKINLFDKFNFIDADKSLNLEISDDSLNSFLLKDALENNLNNCTNIFNKIIPNNKNKFILYNTAYYQPGNYFYLNKKCNAKKPIYINNNIKQNDLKSYYNSRFLFHFSKGSSATIILNEVNNSKILSNVVYELYLEEDSNIELIINSNKSQTTQILNLGSRIDNNACLKIFPIDISGKLIKNNYFINLNGLKSEFHYNGLNLLNDNNYIDNYIEINHNNKHSVSHVNHKNALLDKSKGIFYSKSTINNNCTNSEAHQNNNNLILSKKATVHSNPQLMIHNDNVQCSHGSTTGKIDNDALFYLRSRGIDFIEAKRILLNAFLNNIIDNIKNEEINLIITEKINSWINKYVNKK
tara:strand:- start:2391 stop:3554 length:1164 start_codon:yes stop_codon:yes gene_type:complete